jgi:glutamate synthase domain-containing protein 1
MELVIQEWQQKVQLLLRGSHPYSTREDECLVHNGSLSNHNNVRRDLNKRRSKF